MYPPIGNDALNKPDLFICSLSPLVFANMLAPVPFWIQYETKLEQSQLQGVVVNSPYLNIPVRCAAAGPSVA